MGVASSLQKISSFESYHTLIQKKSNSIYFGRQLRIFKNKFNPKQQFISHTIEFNEIKEMEYFIKQIKQLSQTQQSPFNILNPVNVFVKQQSSLINNITTSCSDDTPKEVVIVHKWLGKTLEDVVREKGGRLNQKLVWFVINEISKSLELLQDKNHSCYHLMPQTIYCNQNQNFLIYDGHFIIGPQHQSLDQFNRKNFTNKEFLSQDFRKKIEPYSLNSNYNPCHINNYEYLQEDLYCFGYCIIFMLTGIHPKEMPSKEKDRETYCNDLFFMLEERNEQNSDRLDELQNGLYIQRYSSELISLIKNLIKSDPKRRYTIRHLRSILKSKEQQIFFNEEEQWSKTTINENKNPRQQQLCNTISKFKKVNSNSNNLKSSQKFCHLNEKLLGQETSDKNVTSVRTLKKQPVPQKLVMMNNNILRLPLSLNGPEHNYRNSKVQRQGGKLLREQNHFDREGQTTPIRKIKDPRVNTFKNEPINTFQNFESQSTDNLAFLNNLRQIGSPAKQNTNQTSYQSPKKLSTVTLNPPVFNQQTSNMAHAHTLSHYRSSGFIPTYNIGNHSDMHSPPHHTQFFQSPVKVKLNYFSPQKSYL